MKFKVVRVYPKQNQTFVLEGFDSRNGDPVWHLNEETAREYYDFEIHRVLKRIEEFSESTVICVERVP